VLALVSGSVISIPALAQDDGRGGLSATLTLAERLELARNRTLTPGGDDLSLQSITTLGYAFRSETRTQTFRFDASLGLNGSWMEGGDPEFSLGERALSLGYAIDGVRSSVDISASATQSDVSFLRPLTDFITEGGLILPEDFDDLSGSGTRTDLSFGARLTIRDDAPFGLTFGFDANDTTYRDTNDPDLVDSRRLGLDVRGRFDVNSAIQVTAGLRYSTFEDGDGGSGDNVTYSVDATISEPRGALSFGASITPTGDGNQIGFDVGRSIDLPDGSLGGNIGLTLLDDGATQLTGGLNYTLERSFGTLTATLDHSVASDAGQTGDVTTSLSLSGSTELTPDVSASLRAGYARFEEAGSDTVTGITDLGATVSYALAPDWSLSGGASYVLRDPSDGPSGASQSVFLTLTRQFDMRN